MFDSVISRQGATERTESVLLDRLALFDLVKEERYARDHNQWRRLAECYAPRSRVRTMWFEGTAAVFAEASAQQVRGPSFGRHMVIPMDAQIKADRAWVEAEAMIQVRMTHQGEDLDIDSYVRFLYRAERVEEAWKLVTFDCIYLKDRLAPAAPGAASPVTSDALAPFRASYAYLCWLFSQTGHAPNADLAGVDRPETVDALYREMSAWLDGAALAI